MYELNNNYLKKIIFLFYKNKNKKNKTNENLNEKLFLFNNLENEYYLHIINSS